MATIESLFTHICQARGHVIQFALEIETNLDIYIAKYFTSDETKQIELIALVVAPRVSLKDKLDIFRYLADKYNPEFKKENQTYYNDMLDFIEKRNMFAHYPIDFGEDCLQNFDKYGSFRLMKLKNAKATGLTAEGIVTAQFLDALLYSMRHYSIALFKLNGLESSA